MKATKLLFKLLLLLLIPFLYGQRGCVMTPSTPELFEQAWKDFDQHYSYFTYKGIDWNAVKEQYAPTFQQEMDAEEFTVQLNEMLQVLHDWHVSVQSPKGNVYGYNSTYEVNRPGWSVTSQYITDAVDLADGTITHGIVGNNIAYIDITSLETSAFQSISDDDIEQIFQKYANASGMIIDIRANNGGYEENAVRFCSRLTEESYEYGYTKNRNGPNHDDFDPPESHALDPNTGTHFNGPVVGLIGKKCMSSAEWFTLMMKRNPAVTLIGEKTRGASGFPQTYQLPNNVSYAISIWMAYTYYDEVIEDNGIFPDIEISYEQSFDDTHDYVLERAIAYIEKGETTPTTTTIPGGATTTSMPGGGGGLTTTTSMPGGGGGGTTTSSSIPGGTTTTTSTSTGLGPSLTVDPPSGQVFSTFVFIAQAGMLADSVEEYLWDFDGDGQAYGWEYGYGIDYISDKNIVNTSEALFYYWYPGTYTAYVIMSDGNENYEIASTTVTVTE